MKALVFRAAGQMGWEDVPEPRILQPTDAIVKIDTTTICGTDLHILKGDVPAVTPGRILGHEGVGTITEIGAAVTTLAVGDQVILSCVSACGKCTFYKQAEFVRVPYAETSVYKLPETVTAEDGTLLSDILPTGFEIGVQYGHVKPGDVVAVVGAGPVGLSTVVTAGLYGPSRIITIDLDAHRVAEAKGFGATDGVVSSDDDWREQVLAMTDGLGVDVAIEAVGIPATFQMCLDIIRPAGHLANVGVHGKSVDLALQDLWITNIVMSMGLVNTSSTETLLKLVAQGRIQPHGFISHRFALSDIVEAYDVFGRAAETKALKVILSA